MSAHAQIIWDILSSLAVILAVVAAHLKAKARHDETSKRIAQVENTLTTPTGEDRSKKH